MDISFSIKSDFGFEQIELRVRNSFNGAIDKIINAVKDGRLPVGPYCSDWECDDDGAAWVNAELVIDGVWHGIGVFWDEHSEETLLITRGLEHDALDGTAEPIRDLDHYWMSFITPLKKVLGIVG